MSPSPANNDPGDGDGEELHGVNLSPAGFMAMVDSASSDEEELEENVELGIGYQLLAPGIEFQAPAGPGDSDDDTEDDDDIGEESTNNSDDALHEHPQIAEVSVSETSDKISHPMPHLQVPPLTENTELKELTELWKTPRLDSELTPMDQDQINTIKSAMAGFTLPASSLPQWATVISENEWKTELLSRLSCSKSDSKSLKSVEIVEGVDQFVDHTCLTEFVDHTCLTDSAKTDSSHSKTHCEPTEK